MENNYNPFNELVKLLKENETISEKFKSEIIVLALAIAEHATKTGQNLQ